MCTIPIHRTKIEQLIRSHRRSFFSVAFVKKDKSIRKILCILPKPKEHPKHRSPAHIDNPYILVTDVLIYRQYLKQTGSKLIANDKSYRLINLSTIVSFKLAGQQYVVVDL